MQLIIIHEVLTNRLLLVYQKFYQQMLKLTLNIYVKNILKISIIKFYFNHDVNILIHFDEKDFPLNANIHKRFRFYR